MFVGAYIILQKQSYCKSLHLVQEGSGDHKKMKNDTKCGKILYSTYARVRDERGLTDYRVASDLGLTTAFMSNWKNQGYCPRIDRAKAIAKRLDITLDELCEEV